MPSGEWKETFEKEVCVRGKHGFGDKAAIRGTRHVRTEGHLIVGIEAGIARPESGAAALVVGINVGPRTILLWMHKEHNRMIF